MYQKGYDSKGMCQAKFPALPCNEDSVKYSGFWAQSTG